jgi:hypothetical protein
MCKRNTTDPLVRTFLDDYGLNLLRIPRAGADCGDLYVKRGRAVSAPGRLLELLEPELELPAVARGETLANLSGTFSSRFDLEVGLGLLESFFIAMGAGGLVDKVKVGYQRGSGRALRFRFQDATRDSVDPLALGSALIGKRFRTLHPFVSSENEYFVVGAVVRTPSVSVTLEDQRSRAVELDAGVLTFVNAHARVSAARERRGEVTFGGHSPLAMGVELYELSYDERARRLEMRTAEDALPLRAKPSPLRPAFVADEDDVLLDVRS